MKTKKINFKIVKKGLVLQVASLLIAGGMLNEVFAKEISSSVTVSQEFNGTIEDLIVTETGDVNVNEINNSVYAILSNSILSQHNVENNGNIKVSLYNDGDREVSSTGIYIPDVNISASIINNGNIENNMTNINNNTSVYSTGIYINEVEDGSLLNIQNNGEINLNLSSESNGSINLSAGIAIADNIANSAILNIGDININIMSLGTYESGIELSDINNTLVKNEGDIKLEVNSSNAIIAGIVIENSYFSEITNSGNIQVNSLEGDYYSNAILIKTNLIDSNITNIGEINLEANNSSERIIAIAVNPDNFTAISSNSVYNSSIVNNGSISLKGTNTYLEYLNIDADIIKESSFINDGNINIIAKNSGSALLTIRAEDINNTVIMNKKNVNVTLDNESSYWGFFVNASNVISDTVISNEGSINVIAEKSDIIAFWINGDLRGNTLIENTGILRLENNNSINGIGNIWGINVGIFVDSDMYDNSKFINSGDMYLYDYNVSGVYGMGTNYMYDNSSFINTGTININANYITDYDVEGIWILGMDNNATFENKGDINIISNKNEYVEGLWAGSLKGNSIIANSGKIIINGSDNNKIYGIMLEEMEENATFINTGLISVNDTNTSTLQYSVYVYNPSEDEGGEIINEGTMEGSIYIESEYTNLSFVNKGDIKLDLNTNTQFTNYIQTSSGILELSLYTDGNISNTSVSKVTGDEITIEDGSTIKFNVTSDSTNEKEIIDNNLTNVIVANNNLDVNVTKLNVTDNSVLLKFIPYIDGNSLNFNIVKGLTIKEAISDSGEDYESIGSVLDTLQDIGTSGELKEFLDNLNTLDSEEEVADAAIQAAPINSASTSLIVSLMMEKVSNIVSSYQGLRRGFNSGDDMFISQNFWMKPFVGKSIQDNKDGKKGFDSDFYGVGIGYDVEYELDKRAGIAFFATKNNTDVNDVPQTSKVNAYTIIGYGSNMINDKDTLNYQFSLGIQKTKSDRTIELLNIAAHSEYNVKVLGAEIKWDRRYQINNNSCIYPSLGYAYRYIKVPSYTESGAGTLNLSVDGFSSKEGFINAGFNFRHMLKEENILSFNMGMGYNTIDTDKTVTASFVENPGLSFETNGIDNGRWKFNAGIDYEILLKNNNKLNITGEYNIRGSGFRSYSGSFKYEWNF